VNDDDEALEVIIVAAMVKLARRHPETEVEWWEAFVERTSDAIAERVKARPRRRRARYRIDR
jgi:hypothetical protein